jgi:subtilisin family serine protease
MPVKVLGATGTGSSLAVAAGIEWAVDNGADVINLSLSSPSSTQAMQDAVDYAWGTKGVIVVAASGNDNGSVKYPAAYADVIAVGATDSNGDRASFSNYGPQLDVVAPGESVLSTLATGFGDSGGWYGWGSGTSFSSPHVAGVVGLMISNGITNKNTIVSALTSTAVDAGTAGFDNEYGWGIVDAAAAVTGGVDTTPPTVSITSPANRSTVSGTFTMTATASDAGGVQKVQFWVDSTYLGYDGTAPYSKKVDTAALTNGYHSVRARAVDRAGNVTTMVRINITVINPETTAPTVNIDAPVAGATLSGAAVVISASATDNKGIQKLQFWVDTTYIGYDSTLPYSKTIDTTALTDGPHMIKVRAVDWGGNMATKSVAVMIDN